MPFEPNTWFLNTVAGKLTERGLKALAKDLDANIADAVKAWADKLPAELAVDPRAMFHQQADIAFQEHVSRDPDMQALTDCLVAMRVPEAQLWERVFRMRRRYIMDTNPNAATPFFAAANDQAVHAHIQELAQAAERVCAVDERLARNTQYQRYKKPPAPQTPAWEPHPKPAADELPEPGELPPVRHMPILHNQLFVGRRRDMLALAGVLLDGKTAAIGQITAATGLGGIGKTQTAVEMVYRYGRFFRAVFWLNCAEADLMDQEIAAAGKPLNLPNLADHPPPQQAQRVKQAWEQMGNILVILDNCEDPAVLERILPLRGAVLLTSRNRDWRVGLAVNQINLDVLPPEDSIALLCKLCPDLTEEEAARIAEALGHLPLALHLAGCYLERYLADGGVTGFLENLAAQPVTHPALCGEGAEGTPTGHIRHVSQTFALSYKRLQDQDPIDDRARRLLAAATVLAPGEPIPHHLLPGMEGASHREGIDALRRLENLGLIRSLDRQTVVIHRLVAAFTRQTLPSRVFSQARDQVYAVVETRAKAANQTQLPSAMDATLVHLRHTAEAARASGVRSAVSLAYEVGNYHRLAGLYRQAEAWLRDALAEARRSLETGDGWIGLCQNTLGLVLWHMGALQEARALLQASLDSAVATLAPNDIVIATIRSNLALVLQEMGDLDGARALLEAALEADVASRGVDHPSVATRRSNLAGVLREMGDLDGARALLEAALEADVASLGADHPHVARNRSNLAMVLLEMGDLEGARALLEAALEAGQASLGANHPSVAIRLNNLSHVEYQAGKLPLALDYSQRACAIAKTCWGLDHPTFKILINHLHTLRTHVPNAPAAHGDVPLSVSDEGAQISRFPGAANQPKGDA